MNETQKRVQIKYKSFFKGKKNKLFALNIFCMLRAKENNHQDHMFSTIPNNPSLIL